MTTIWKFPLEIQDRQEVAMPLHARPLSVGLQGTQPMLWALVDDYAPLVPYVIRMRGTGHSCTGLNEAQYLGRISLPGPLEFHIFFGGD